MKILLISSAAFPVFPPTYGGLEQVVGNLAVELVKRGHDVTVAGVKGTSQDSGFKVIETTEPASVDNYYPFEEQAYNIYRDKLKDFDLVSQHNWFGHAYLYKREHPELRLTHTLHGHANWQTPPPVKYPCLIALSHFMAKQHSQRWGVNSRVCYNGIDLSKYPFHREKDDRLLYVGRFAPFKQPHVAIDIARRLKMPLDLCGGTWVPDKSYVQRIYNDCDGKQIRWFGDASHEVKLRLMQEAKALLFPSAMGEPWGLVAAEAMATGTKVLALRDGAIPEVVQEGGIVCDNPDEMVEAIRSGKIDEIKPEACRENAERFSREHMCDGYLKCFESILKDEEW